MAFASLAERDATDSVTQVAESRAMRPARRRSLFCAISRAAGAVSLSFRLQRYKPLYSPF